MSKSFLLSISLLFFFSACNSNTSTDKEQASAKLPSTEIEKNSSTQSQPKDENITQAVLLQGETLSSKCLACHGDNFEKSALGKSAILKGQTADAIETSLKAYKNGTLNKAGMGPLMKGQVGYMSDDELKAMAAYISTK